MSKVIVASVKNKAFTVGEIDAAVERAIDQLHFNFAGIRNIFVKPNLCYYWSASTGETTDGRVVSSVIRYLKERTGGDANITVAEADASAMKTKLAFKILGYDELCRKNDVPLLNLSEGNQVQCSVKVGGSDLSIPFNEALLSADLVVNVPKLKTHNVMGVTCAMKNMFGAISKPRKYDYHPNLANVIVAANKIVKSQITVVDGLIAKGSCPRKLGVVMASNDVLANDYVAAELMSFNPRKVPYIKVGAKEKIGEIRNIGIVEDGVKIADIKKNFPHYSHRMHTISWGIQLSLLNFYAKLSGDVLPPFLEK